MAWVRSTKTTKSRCSWKSKIFAILTDFRLNHDPETVQLTYEFRPRGDLDGDPASERDFEFVCYGGEIEANEFGHDRRRRITMDLLPVLRDAEGDLGSWRRVTGGGDGASPPGDWSPVAEVSRLVA